MSFTVVGVKGFKVRVSIRIVDVIKILRFSNYSMYLKV